MQRTVAIVAAVLMAATTYAGHIVLAQTPHHLAVAALAVTTAAQLPVLGLLANGGSAQIVLVDASGTLAQTADTPWTLDKTGALSGSTVTWEIVATPGTTQTNRLQVQGQMTVANLGSGPATIGNIVVNLQHRVGNKWVTVASDVANATDGDAATVARIHAAGSSEGASIFTENAASGALEFMDATSNTIFSLVPQVLIGAGETRPLLFTAAFDNTLLNFTPGTLLRAEVIVSFGNATAKGNSTANVDINGNGSLDADEARVRSVPARFTAPVPAPVTGNDEVTLSDTLSDLTSTGTVTFSNVVINLGATSGTVAATVDGGTSGGTITNCAHLTTADQTTTSGGFALALLAGVDLQACSTITVTPTPTCTPGAPGCGWRVGDLVTFDQAHWGSTTNPASALLSSNYFSVYPNALLIVGISGTSGFSAVFTSASAVIGYLPASGTPGPLTSDLLNPTSSSSGQLGGETVGLKLNTDFTALTGGSSGVDLGGLTLCGFTTQPLLNGKTVDDILADMNSVLGGGSSSTYGAAELNTLASSINTSFLLGQPSAWAQAHLVNGSCGGWQAGDLVTYGHGQWGTPGTTAGNLLASLYNTVYFSSGGLLEVGIAGAGGFSIAFFGGGAVGTYLPSVGTPAALTGDVVNPTSTSSGILGGEVTSLALNVDFSAAGVLGGALTNDFGTLLICGAPGLSSNMSIASFLTLAEETLGGANTGLSPATIQSIAQSLNTAFLDGTPSTFAQDHLVNGGCP